MYDPKQRFGLFFPGALVLVGIVCSGITAPYACASELKVGLVLDRGGRDDKSFNSAAYLGATDAKKKLGIDLKTVEASDDNAFEPLMRALAQKDYDLIIGIGVSQADALKKVASQFPNKKFAIVDAEVNLPNVQSLLFEEHEGSFLVGAIAAVKSKSKQIGFLGGMDIPLIRRFQRGYEAGAKWAADKKGFKLANIKVNYIGVTGEAWNDPTKARELGLAQYQSGVDVIFAPAGASNLGLFNAAEEKKKFAIGVDSNQNWIKPGLILTSMLKRVDLAVFNAIEQAKSGKFQAGILRSSLKNSGIDYAVDQYNEKLLNVEDRAFFDQLKKDIISGKVSVPDYYKEQKDKKKKS